MGEEGEGLNKLSIGSMIVALFILELGMTILSSPCYTRKQLRGPPICGVGRASTCIDHVKKESHYKPRSPHFFTMSCLVALTPPKNLDIVQSE